MKIIIKTVSIVSMFNYVKIESFWMNIVINNVIVYIKYYFCSDSIIKLLKRFFMLFFISIINRMQLEYDSFIVMKLIKCFLVGFYILVFILVQFVLICFCSWFFGEILQR